MSNKTDQKAFPVVCPYCSRTWYPQSDGYNEYSFCDECEPERIQVALQVRVEKGVTFKDVGSYTIEVPTEEELALGAQLLEELFKPRPCIFLADATV